MAIHAVTGGDEFVLIRARVHQHQVHVAVPPHAQGLAGADRDDVHPVARGALESREQEVQQTRALGAGRRRELDYLRVGRRRCRHREGRYNREEREEFASRAHVVSQFVGESTQAVANTVPSNFPAKPREFFEVRHAFSLTAVSI